MRAILIFTSLNFQKQNEKIQDEKIKLNIIGKGKWNQKKNKK